MRCVTFMRYGCFLLALLAGSQPRTGQSEVPAAQPQGLTPPQPLRQPPEAWEKSPGPIDQRRFFRPTFDECLSPWDCPPPDRPPAEPLIQTGAFLQAPQSRTGANPREAPGDPSGGTLGTGSSVFPQIPGLKGVRGLTGLVGSLVQTVPHIGATWYPDQNVDGQDAQLGMTRGFYQLAVPVWSNGTDAVILSSHIQDTAIRTQAILPDSHVAFPKELWNVWFGVNYFHTYQNGTVAGMLFEAGSASDKPFHSADELSVAGTAFTFIPSGERNAWMLALHASTNSQIFYNLPIPGAAYLYNPSDRFQAIIGLPFAAINYEMLPRWRMQLLYFLLTTVHARTIYEFSDNVQVYAGFDWANENYDRVGRPNVNDRFYYYEKRLGVGGQWWFARNWGLEVSSGYAFDRYFVESNGFSLGGSNRVAVGNGPYLSAQIDVRF